MIEEYLEYLKNVRNYSSHTISSYESDLLSWSEYLNNKKINYLHVNKDEILGYLKYLDDKILDKNSLLENLFSEKKEVRNDIFDYCVVNFLFIMCKLFHFWEKLFLRKKK